MLTDRQIAAVAQVGMLAGEPDTVPAAVEALRVLGEALGADAATVVGLSPLTGEHLPLAEVGYAPEVNRVVVAEFVGTPWHREVVAAHLPASISDEPGQRFRRGSFYQQYVEPAGFRDCMSGALRHRGRYLGLVHLSATRADAFDAEARHLLGGVLPALARLADLTGRAARWTAVPPGEPAALVIGEQVVTIPDHERPAVLADVDFGRLLARFAGAAEHQLRLYWAVGRQWFEIVLARQSPLPGAATAPAVLVHAHPTRLPYGLSARELDVLTRVALGHSNPAIAQALFLSPRTVHSHVEHIMRKTGTASRIEAAGLAIRENLLRPTTEMPLAKLAR